jgi:putative phosphoribosyl transferase
MTYVNREQAGSILASHLQKYKNKSNTVVLGLPRGGVVTAHVVAKNLNLPLDITCPRKIGAPANPEYAIGAITETGEGLFNQAAITSLGVTKDYLESMIEREKMIAQKRLQLFRSGKPPLDVKNKTVILVDDGLATGFTMKVAIKSIKRLGAKKIIVAVPVAPKDTCEEIKEMVDALVCPLHPTFFYAVGQFYQDFQQTEDIEVVDIMKNYNK